MNSIYGNPISVEDIPDGVQKCNCKKECNCIGLRNTIKGYLLNAHQAITELGYWNKLATQNPKEGGFMFTTEPWLIEIYNHPKVKEDAHSGGSMSETMRFMEYIALNGWKSFVEDWSL
jgi:hypothetical protein